MSPRPAPEQPESSELSSTNPTSSTNCTDETVSNGFRRYSTVERFFRCIDAYTTALNTLESNLLTINREKTALSFTYTITKFEATTLSEAEVIQARKLRRRYWRERRRLHGREKHLQNQLVVLTRWVNKLKRDIEEFVKEDEGGSRDEDEDEDEDEDTTEDEDMGDTA